MISASYSQTPQKKYIRYLDLTLNDSHSFVNQSIPPKTNRLSSNHGNIITLFDESLPDTVQAAITVAKNMWEAKIVTKQPIIIQFIFEDLNPDVAMITAVGYSDLPDPNPTALNAQLLDRPYGDLESPDGMVIFNSNISWNCNYSDNKASDYNIPTMALRGIAKCLGFGTSLCKIIGPNNVEYFTFNLSKPSGFDKLLHNSTEYLSNIANGSPQMEAFATSENVVAETQKASYRIYSPMIYEPDVSLCYFDTDNSIMSKSLNKGNIALSIDDNTIDVLRTIGWDFIENGKKIICNNISENGIGSSYESHTFSLDAGNDVLSNFEWKFYLKDTPDNHVLISQSSLKDFTIEKITSPQDYYVNMNGDLEGKIECEYTLNGVKQKALPFALYLELKPEIISVDNIILDRTQYDFSLYCTVRYTGADRISVEVEEEYNTMLRSYRFDEPFVAHIKTGRITSLYNSWITIVVSNKYGRATKTLEYVPQYYNNLASDELIQLDMKDNLGLLSDNNKIMLFDMNGTVVYEGLESSLSTSNFHPGIYIKRSCSASGKLKNEKIIIQ